MYCSYENDATVVLVLSHRQSQAVGIVLGKNTRTITRRLVVLPLTEWIAS